MLTVDLSGVVKVCIFHNHSGIFQNFTMNFYNCEKWNEPLKSGKKCKCYLTEQCSEVMLKGGLG